MGKSLSVRHKLFTILIVAFVVLSIFSTYGLSTISDRIQLDNRNRLSQVVEVAVSLIKRAQQRVVENEISEADARIEVLKEIKALNFEGNNYFWVNDSNAKIIMHPTKPQLDGTDGNKIVDPNGVALFSEFARVARTEGQGFVDYYWERPGELEPVPKLSYVLYNKQWDWVVGAGVYVDDVEAAIRAAGIRFVGFAVVGIAIMVLITTILIRSLSSSLNTVNVGTKKVASGDLTDNMIHDSKDEFGQLVDHLNGMLDQWRGFVKGIQQSAQQVNSTSVTLSNSAVQTESSTSVQLSRTEELSSAMEEMARTSDKMAHHVGEVSNSAGLALSEAKEGSQHVLHTKDNMNQLAEAVIKAQDAINQVSSDTTEITSILDDIKGISEQTNLLALNAAIEAARAGDTGRGFAVVADEVRALAQRTQDSASEIQNKIERLLESAGVASHTMKTSGEHAQSGVDSVQAVSNRLNSILERVEEVNEMSGQIADATQQQSEVAIKMAERVDEVKSISEQNFKQAEAVAEQSQVLDDCATLLQEQASIYRI